jgi:hypothetical protein
VFLDLLSGRRPGVGLRHWRLRLSVPVSGAASATGPGEKRLRRNRSRRRQNSPLNRIPEDVGVGGHHGGGFVIRGGEVVSDGIWEATEGKSQEQGIRN